MLFFLLLFYFKPFASNNRKLFLKFLCILLCYGAMFARKWKESSARVKIGWSWRKLVDFNLKNIQMRNFTSSFRTLFPCFIFFFSFFGRPVWCLSTKHQHCIEEKMSQKPAKLQVIWLITYRLFNEIKFLNCAFQLKTFTSTRGALLMSNVFFSNQKIDH